MSLQEQLEKLKNDFSGLDMENVGAWPLPVKIVSGFLVVIAVVAISYQLVLKDQRLNLDRDAQKEITLKAEFEKKVQEAANIEAYRSQMAEMTESFSTLLSQLPKDTEVPGLLDDISDKGQQSGLNFEAIDLQQEKKADFYVELPIGIKVKGGYHDFGAFVSGVAGLPRIVTLHDFVIQSASVDSKASSASKKTANNATAQKPASDDRIRDSEELSMLITAKTYRYKSADEEPQPKDKSKKPPAKPAAKNDSKEG